MGAKVANLLEEIGCEHKDVCVLFKGLRCGKVSYAFQVYFGRRHDLHDVK